MGWTLAGAFYDFHDYMIYQKDRLSVGIAPELTLPLDQYYIEYYNLILFIQLYKFLFYNGVVMQSEEALSSCAPYSRFLVVIPCLS